MSQLYNQPYLIVITCEVYKSDVTGLTHRGFVYQVLKAVQSSAALAQMQQSPGDAWKVVRESELLMNIPFDQFENRISELFYRAPIDTQASFMLQYDQFTDNVSRDYFMQHKFGYDNVPWRGMANHYANGQAVTRREYLEKFKVNAMGNTGFSQSAYKDGEHTHLDTSIETFSPEQLKAAERQAEAMSGLLKAMK